MRKRSRVALAVTLVFLLVFLAALSPSEPFALIAMVCLLIIGVIPLIVSLNQMREGDQTGVPTSGLLLKCPRCGATHPSDSRTCHNCNLEFSR